MGVRTGLGKNPGLIWDISGGNRRDSPLGYGGITPNAFAKCRAKAYMGFRDAI